MANKNTPEDNEPKITSRINSKALSQNNSDLTEISPQINNAPDQQQPQQEPQQPLWKTILWQMVTFWVVMQIVKSFTAKKETSDPKAVQHPDKISCKNLFNLGDSLDLYIYYSESQDFNSFSNKSLLLWKETDIFFGSWYDGPYGDGSRKSSGYIQASDAVKSNGSLYYHIYIVKKGYPPDPNHKSYSKYSVVNYTNLMTVYRKQRVHKTKNLLTGEADSQDKVMQTNSTTLKIMSYWHPNLTLNLLDDQTAWVKDSVPSPLDQYITFLPGENFYKPVLYINDYWNYVSDYMPINETTPQLEYHITFAPISMFRWQMYISQNMRSQWNQYLGDSVEQSDQEQDMLKRTLQETNPYLLGLTMIVSLVHSVFEFLAFKNDIQFWKSRKTLEGLSVRSIFFNVFQSLIVLLYVLDNETNTIVVVSCFVGLLIEAWKITKVVDIKRHPTKKWGPFPAITFEDKSSYVQSDTKQYDRLAFQYLSWALFPLLGCYAIYSLFYSEHKGWYSFVLNIAYGFLLTFGFIMMTPQLFINYKMKSIAHLPWRMLTYKALNTFIDDIFAFVIKMPTLYRLGCLRDDIIFFIYLYQRWIYPIDHSRVNEFGLIGEPEQVEVTKEVSDKDAITPCDIQTQKKSKKEQ